MYACVHNTYNNDLYKYKQRHNINAREYYALYVYKAFEGQPFPHTAISVYINVY